MKKINIGLIGFGYWGPNYARILKAHPNINFLAVSDLNTKLLKEAKKNYQVEIYTDYRELLKNQEIEAVLIVTPAVTHYQIVKDSLKMGKHVLVEKPLAKNSKQAKELTDLAYSLNKILMVGHTFLFNPHFQKLKEFINKKELGQIRFITSTRINLGPVRPDVNCLWDLAPHDLSMILDLVGQMPYEVFAFGESYLNRKNIDIGFVNLRFPKNIIANLTVSWLSPVKSRPLMVVGSKKMAIFDDLKPVHKLSIYDKRVMLPRGSSFTEFTKFGIYAAATKNPPVEGKEPLKNKVDHFLECILESKKPLSGGEVGWNIIKILEACDKSLETGRVVKL
jgi:predicted dehydrogenase